MSSRTFKNVTQAVWNCVQQNSVKQHNTSYTPPPPSNQGTSSTPAVGSTVDMKFNFDPQSGTVTYEITHKPFVVPENQIWSGIESSINACR
jgi:hypothetical protein